MRLKVFAAAAVAALAMLCLPAMASAKSYTTQLLHFTVHVGPGKATACNVIGELYRPKTATAKHREPAILTTNGFGGSYKSQDAYAEQFADDGYVVLEYSGLGFGGSGCRITLDSTTYDGEAASQLVTFLGGGSSATTETGPAVKVNYVTKQKRAPNGKTYKYDPVVGMIGGSYGGAVQFAAAAVDPRIDTIVPMITWNNLSYSLAPNNATLKSDTVNSSVPGITKDDWLEGFWLIGTAADDAVDPTDPPSTCLNFAADLCTPEQELTTDGYPDAATLSTITDASVANFMHDIRIPTMLMQGEDDTLFTLHEAVATYDALRAQHTPVKMVWQSWGHSDPNPVKGEMGGSTFGVLAADNPNGTLTLEGKMMVDWFDHYLKHSGPAPALNFSYYRPWVKYKGYDVAAAYASAPRYPVGKGDDLYLSGSDALVTAKSKATSGTSVFTTPTATGAQSQTEDPLKTTGGQSIPLTDPAGTFAAFESAPLAKTLDVVGIPTVKLTITAPAAELSGESGPANTIGLYFKLEAVAPNGTVTLPDRLLAAARFTDNGKPVTVDLPGIVHQFAKGDRIKLVIAGSDSSYFLANTGVTVTVASGGGVLSLPVESSFKPVKLTS